MAALPPPRKKSLIDEFKEFLNQGDFVTIAVGLIIALYFQSIVNAILVGVLFPIISQIGFDIGDARISIGLVITAIINFVVVGFLLFLIVRAWNRFKERGGDRATPRETELSVLRDIRESLRAGGRGPV
jgi:large conductance mechanosensitive channel